MAYVGARKPIIAPLNSDGTYGTPVAWGKVVNFSEAPNSTSAELYGDDALAESEKATTGAGLTLGTTDIPDAVQEPLFGHSATDGERIANINDEAGYCGMALIGSKKVNGVRSYEARFYPKTQWNDPSVDINTRAGSTEFQTPSTEGTAMPLDNGDWRYVEEFATEAAALAYINGKFGATVTGGSTNTGATGTGSTGTP